jgi:putative oxygen-independent coproporphyrinogen III oxidase
VSTELREPRVEQAGLYVHIPFCLTRCGYCDFNTYAGLDHLMGGYVDALLGEAELWTDEWAGTSFVSLFMGGGTPTTLPIDTLRGLIDHIRDRLGFAPGAEVTVEANPDTVDEAYLKGMLGAGVVRLSLGVQSFDPAVLLALERIHSADAARAAFLAARRAGFDDVNLDLIYGADGESLASWRHTLEEAISLGPQHLSCYALTVEPATSLGRQVAAGLKPAPDPDLQADMYFVACDLLADAGFEHYEVSNWALPGHRPLHNMGYWEGRPYLGLGAGAHSYRDGTRWWNVRPPAQYMAAVSRGDRPIGGSERLSEDERRTERLLLGLRVSDGIPGEQIDLERGQQFVEAGLAQRHDGRFALTDRGLFVANEIVASLAT